MVDFRTEKDLERWIDSRNSTESVMIAARSALRVLPGLADGGKIWASQNYRKGNYESSVVLPTFRGVTAAYVKARFFSRDQNRNAFLRASDDASRAAGAAMSLTSRECRAAFAAHASDFAARAAFASSDAAYNNTLRILDATRRAVSASASPAASVDAAFAIAAVEADATTLELGVTVRGLADRPLWPNAVPNLATEQWQRLKCDLLERNEGWDVWTDWYEARLNGRRPWSKSLELARIALDEQFWKAGPKAVNDEIGRLIKKKRIRETPLNVPVPPLTEQSAILAPRPSSYRFDWRGERIEAVAITERPFDPVLAEAIAQALREKADDLLAALTGNHADVVVSRDVRRALDLLGTPVDRIAEGVLLMRANTIGAHARAYTDAGSDRERLIRAILDDVSTSLGNLVDCYPGVRLINASRVELEVQAADAPAIAAQLDAIADLAKASPIVAASGSAALDVGRAETADLDAKIAGPSGVGRAGYIAARAKVVAARLLDTTNFVSATAQRAQATGGLPAETLRELRKALPKPLARGVSKASEKMLAGLPDAGSLLLAYLVAGHWGALAVLVGRLAPHAAKIERIARSIEKLMRKEGGEDDDPSDPLS